MGRGREALEGIVWILVGAMIDVVAVRLDLGSFGAPGPGFVPFLAGLTVAVFGSILFATNLLSKKSPEEATPADRALRTNPWPRLLYTMVLLVGYVLLLDSLGYVVATFLAMWGLFLQWKERNWIRSGLSAGMTSLVTYVIFNVWLGCQLPQGICPWW